ncbi:MAG: rhamnan synthesis F family protein [Lachnospiraceae bacterium]|nr:rhamnan synthesis F family protein [Lachnospiraceae bacterium]
MKRLCIYLTYDKQGIVDSYIEYMLKELRTIADRLIVVCNQPQIVSGEHFLKCADYIYYRENLGFDAGGFKDALCEYIGWNQVWEYDELVLANDSFFGPFRPMREIFDEMNQKEADFWGLTMHKEYTNQDGTRLTPEHVQSFFLVFRSKLLHSDLFQEFWESMPYYQSFSEAIEKYEKQLTKFFNSAGYSYTGYADTRANDTDNIKNNFNQFIMIPNELVQKRRFPFLKKQQIAYHTLDQQTQENIPLVLDYIKKHTNYDINMIYENIIRLMNVSDLQRRLCLHYILDEKQETGGLQASKIAVAVLIEHSSSFAYVMEKVKKLWDKYHILVLAKSQELLNGYKEKGLECIECIEDNRHTIIDKLISFDLVCVLHDADMSSDRIPSYVGKSKFYNIWENLAGSDDYIRNVVDLFRQNEKVGILTAPRANFGDYFGSTGAGWNGRFEEVRRCMDEKQVQCHLDYLKPPFEIIENYWIRGGLFACLRSWEPEFLELLPWIWCYIAQSRGFLTGTVESRRYAGMNEINKQYYLDAIGAQIREQFGGFHSFVELQEVLSKRAVVDYCQKHEKIYVYGTGEFAKKFSPVMPNIEAYVVSDNQNKQQVFRGRKVLYLSEISNIEGTGLVVCLDKTNQAQVVPQLRKRGFKDYFCV